MLVAAQAGQLGSSTAGMIVVLFILSALTLVWLWAVWHLFREGRWTEGLKDAALVALWIGLLAGGAWLLSAQIGHARDVARRAIPEYCPQVGDEIRRGARPLEAARAAVRRMEQAEPAIETLDDESLARRLLRVCRERTGWSGFRVPPDTARSDTSPADTSGGGPADVLPGGGRVPDLPGAGSGG